MNEPQAPDFYEEKAKGPGDFNWKLDPVDHRIYAYDVHGEHVTEFEVYLDVQTILDLYVMSNSVAEFFERLRERC